MSLGRAGRRTRALLIGEDTGIGPILALTERLRDAMGPPPVLESESRGQDKDMDTAPHRSGGRPPPGWKPLVLLGSDRAFPFRPRPSAVIVAGIPTGVIACMPLLEDWGIPCRLASHSDLPGCFAGSVIALADTWLASLGAPELSELEIVASGPAAMLEMAGALARRYAVPFHSSLELG